MKIYEALPDLTRTRRWNTSFGAYCDFDPSDLSLILIPSRQSKKSNESTFRQLGTMQSYINHLLEDIIAAQRPEEPYIPKADIKADPISEDVAFEKDMEEMERWMESDPEHTFSHYCALEKEQFPPAGQLTEEQILQVIKEFRHLLFSWNLDASIPDELPHAQTYTLLVSLLDRKTDIVSSGFMTFEFCSYDVPTCVFGEYCQCKEFENESEEDFKSDLKEGDLPF